MLQEIKTKRPRSQKGLQDSVVLFERFLLSIGFYLLLLFVNSILLTVSFSVFSLETLLLRKCSFWFSDFGPITLNLSANPVVYFQFLLPLLESIIDFTVFASLGALINILECFLPKVSLEILPRYSTIHDLVASLATTI